MIYKRGKSNIWYVAYYVKGENGKLVKTSFSTKTDNKDKALLMEQEARASIKKTVEEKRYGKHIMETAQRITGLTVKLPGMNLLDVWDIYSALPNQKQGAERTLDSKRQAWDNFSNWIKKSYPMFTKINEVSQDMAAEYMEIFKDLSKGTFRRQKSYLHHIWESLALKAKMTDRNVWSYKFSSEPRGRFGHYRPLTDKEVQAILNKCSGFWHHAVTIAYQSGLRFTDILHLKWDSIEKGALELIPSKTKQSEKSVYIPIHLDLKKLFNELPRNGEYVFPEAVKAYKETTEFKREFGLILDACGIKDKPGKKVGFHSLRHSFVTRCEESGMARSTVQGIVGHGSPIMTAIYSDDKKSAKGILKLKSITKAS
jgi:integrase